MFRFIPKKSGHLALLKKVGKLFLFLKELLELGTSAALVVDYFNYLHFGIICMYILNFM